MTENHRDNDLRALRGLLETEELSDDKYSIDFG